MRSLRNFQILSLPRNISKSRNGQGIALIQNAQNHTETEIPPSFADEELTEKPTKANFNTSRLLPQHRNLLLENVPYDEAQSWIHNTEKYQRKMFGRYGLASNVDPRICFPNKKVAELKKEYERVAYPHTVQEMMEINRKAKEAKRAIIQKREDDIAKKMEHLDQWKLDLQNKIAKKEREAQAAKEKKERLIEEVRRHFGFKVDPRDDRFKEMLEQKEKEDKKKQKEAKRKAKEDKMLQKLANV